MTALFWLIITYLVHVLGCLVTNMNVPDVRMYKVGRVNDVLYVESMAAL